VESCKGPPPFIIPSEGSRSPYLSSNIRSYYCGSNDAARGKTLCKDLWKARQIQGCHREAQKHREPSRLPGTAQYDLIEWHQLHFLTIFGVYLMNGNQTSANDWGGRYRNSEGASERTQASTACMIYLKIIKGFVPCQVAVKGSLRPAIRKPAITFRYHGNLSLTPWYKCIPTFRPGRQ
jgi:hypothetical protein